MIRQALLAAELLRQLQHADLVADDLLVSRHRVVSSLRYSMSTLGDDTPTIAACQIWSKRIHSRALPADAVRNRGTATRICSLPFATTWRAHRGPARGTARSGRGCG